MIFVLTDDNIDPAMNKFRYDENWSSTNFLRLLIFPKPYIAPRGFFPSQNRGLIITKIWTPFQYILHFPKGMVFRKLFKELQS